MKIRIDNKTDWSTLDLRVLYHAALKAAGASGPSAGIVVYDGTKRARKRSFGVTSARRLIRGRCWIGRPGAPGSASLWLPTPATCLRLGISPADLRDDVARVMHHEALHGVGARHKHMTDAQWTCTQKVPWAEDLCLNVRSARVEPEPSREAAFEDKLAHVRAMRTKATTRLKRAQTIEKKWARRLLLLERKAGG